MSTEPAVPQTKRQLLDENAQLRSRLTEAEETLRAIREGEVDAVIVTGSKGEQVFSLSESESIYRLMVETMAEAGLAVTPEGIILFANDCLGRLLQKPLEQIVGQPLSAFVHPRNQAQVQALLVTPHDNASEGRITLLASDGHPIPVYMWASRLERPDGPTICLVGADLTQLEASKEVIKHLEEQHQALQESEQRLALATSATRIGLFEWNVDNGKVLWTQTVESIFGYAPAVSTITTSIAATQEYDYSRWEDRVHPEDLPALMEKTRLHMRKRRPFEEAYRILWPDGSLHWVEVRGIFIPDANGKPVHMLGVVMDVTERKQVERNLQETQQRLQTVNTSLEQRVAERTAEVQRQADHLRALANELTQAEQRERRRLASILHDHIQQLLVAARMQVAWLKRDQNPERRQAATAGVDGILKEALEAARSLTVELSPPALQMGGLIGALNWLAARMNEKHQFTVHLRADNRAEPGSEEMRFLLFECARELLLNAVKHAGVSQAHVTLVRTQDKRIKLVVGDDGKGFDPDLLKKRSANEVSFGLFSIQQRLAHLSGEMEIATAPGKGTSITLSVPAGEELLDVKEQGVPALKETAGQITVRDKTAARRVLIVDDHKIMREGLAGLMQFEPDIEVVGQAADGPAAIELAAKLQPDAIVMDVNLGDGMNGVEATRRILTANPGIKVIGLSMGADSAVATAMRDAGAAAYLTKGGPSEDLIAAIRAACA